jgi:GNAT superfamily N-acetyltransferase
VTTWTTRPATLEDAAEVQRLFEELDVVEFGQPETDLEDVETALRRPGPSWLAQAEGVAVGYAHVQANGECDTVVPPGAPDGLHQALIEQVIAAGRDLDASVLEHWAGAGLRRTGPALSAYGFQHARTSWLLRHDLQQLAPAVWPDGVTLQPFDRERDARDVHRVITDAFRDLPFSHERSFEEWSSLVLGGFDVVCARRGSDLVGAATHGTRLGDGYVGQLGVVASERGLGLGRALLLTTLAVDGENDSARRLYDSVGMAVVQEYWRWDLAL